MSDSGVNNEGNYDNNSKTEPRWGKYEMLKEKKIS